jgi:glutamine synthetase
MFLGEQLEDIVEHIIKDGVATTSLEGGKLKTGVNTLSDIRKDATDRNRTSPFAFTGNKFEFRMVGSKDSIASPNTTLNAIVAEAFCEAADELEKASDFDSACDALIQKYMTEHERIIFNGNGYSDEWVAEAEKRGLPNIKSMVEAVETLTTDKAVALFEKFGIFTKTELQSREEVLYEQYSKVINIEALTMIDMATKQYIPSVIKYTKELAETVLKVKEAGADTQVQSGMLSEISSLLKDAKAALENLKVAQADAFKKEGKEQAFFYKDVVMKAMTDLRTPVDKLEMLVDKEFWPVPSYGDLTFEV